MNWDNRNTSKFPSPLPGKTGWPWTTTSELLPDKIPDGSPWPKISVVTPSYNQGQFIEETIRSVLLQGYPNLEFIIIDGGSTDNTLEIINKYEPWLDYWVSEPDRGQSHAINKGIKKATGEILFWLNADDLVLPEAFNIVVQLFRQHQNSALIVGQAKLIDSSSNINGEINSYFSTWEEAVTNPQNSIRQISSFFRNFLFDKYGTIDESLEFIMDTDILLRFTQYHSPLVIDDYLTAFRVHPESKSYKEIILAYKESEIVRKKYLNSKDLIRKHRIRNADNWLNLSKKHKLSIHERFTCLVYSAIKNPFSIISSEFFLSLIDIMKSAFQSKIKYNNKIK